MRNFYLSLIINLIFSRHDVHFQNDFGAAASLDLLLRISFHYSLLNYPLQKHRVCKDNMSIFKFYIDFIKIMHLT